MSFTKTITMSFDEYEGLVGEAKNAQYELKRYKDAITTVYGPDEFSKLLDKACMIDEQRHRQNMYRLVQMGEL